MKKLIFVLMFVCLISSVSAIDWNDNLIAYYDFNEGSGTLVEDKTNNPMKLNLTIGNLGSWDNTDGILGNNLRVRTSAPWTTATSTSRSIGLEKANTSVFCWINYTAGSGAIGIAGWGGAGAGNQKLLGLNAPGNYMLFDAEGASLTGGYVTNDQLYLIGYTSIEHSTGGEIRLYLNSTRVAINNLSYSASKSNLTFFNASAGPSWEMKGGIIDECSIWNRTLSQTDINELWNGGSGLGYQGAGGIGSVSITLNSPADNTQFSSTYIAFNSTLTPTIANITNATLYIWNSSSDVFNKTTNIFTGYVTNSTFWNVSNFSLSTSYHWNTLGCVDNSSGDAVCSWALSNRTFTSSAFSTTYVLYNYSVFETQLERFSINISANSLISSASSQLWYNGTSHTSIVTDGTAGVYKANNLIDIDLSSIQSANKTFYWQWTMQLITGETVKQNTSTYSHTVNKTYFEYCNSTNNIQYVNFTTHNAINPFPHVNATFKFRSDHWLGAGTVKRNYSFEQITEGNHTFDFCFSEPSKGITTDSTIEFDSTGYSQNYHYLTGAELTNTTNTIDLYLLNDSLATLTVLNVRDQSQNPLSDVYIQIQLYDVGTDTYYTVGMAKTSFNGEDIAYLNWYDSFYKFILTRNGTVLKTTTPYKVSETPQIFEITTETTFTYDKFDDFLYNLYFNSGTSNFVLIFTKPSGLVDSGCLRVIKRNPSNDSTICNVCETSSSATLYCNIGGYGNGTYIASFYATGSLKIIDTISEFIGAVDVIFTQIGNTDGSIYAFLFAGVVVAMFFFSPVLAIIGMLLGIAGAMAMGFQPVNYLEFIGIVILGGTVLWILKR